MLVSLSEGVLFRQITPLSPQSIDLIPTFQAAVNVTQLQQDNSGSSYVALIVQ